MYRCSDCHKNVRIGEWPFCPHGQPASSKGFDIDVLVPGHVVLPPQRAIVQWMTHRSTRMSTAKFSRP